jgi:hypothetical protein
VPIAHERMDGGAYVARDGMLLEVAGYRVIAMSRFTMRGVMKITSSFR